jgi:hypothetical protein
MHPVLWIYTDFTGKEVWAGLKQEFMGFSQKYLENISMFLFWVVTPCGLVGRYQRFGETGFSPEHGDSMLLRNVGISHESTRRHRQHRNLRCCENLKSHISSKYLEWGKCKIFDYVTQKWLTPCSRIRLEKTILTQVVNKFIVLN